MKMKRIGFALVLLAAKISAAAVSDATTYSRVAIDSRSVSSQSFGANSIEGVGRAQTTTGADANGTPFILSTVETSDASLGVPGATSWLDYTWDVVGGGGSSAPVLVHISTSGWIAVEYGFTPYQLNRYNLVSNDVRAMAAVSFRTRLSNGTDQRVYGLQSSGYNWGVERFDAVDSFQGQNGGSSSTYASFNESFDLWVTPNSGEANLIKMNVDSQLYEKTSFVQQYAKEYFSVRTFVDPVIVIDSAYAADYTLRTSVIPAVAIPEPSTYALFGAGLLVVAGAGRRRKNGSRGIERH